MVVSVSYFAMFPLISINFSLVSVNSGFLLISINMRFPLISTTPIRHAVVFAPVAFYYAYCKLATVEEKPAFKYGGNDLAFRWTAEPLNPHTRRRAGGFATGYRGHF